MSVTSQKFDYLIFIGRFQPPHAGHISVIDKALELSSKIIIILGSAKIAPTIRDPFNTSAREQMIRSCYSEDRNERLLFRSVEDFRYNDDKWISQVRSAVFDLTRKEANAKIGLIGHSKDHSSYYLKLFPDWGHIDVPNYKGLNSTEIRNDFFIKQKIDRSIMPISVIECLERFQQDQRFSTIRDEFLFVEKYKQQWNNSPYPVIFQTVDAVVVQSGHILLIERDAQPGRGLMALPGGFLNYDESLEEGVLRELYEETRISVPKPVLKGSISKIETFDDVHRSSRGRTITRAFLINLKNETSLPKIKGSDDARKAMWVPINWVLENRDQLFEDHYDIITAMIGV